MVAGTVPERQGIQDRNSYTCVYGIQQNISDSTRCTADIPSCNIDYVPGDNTQAYYYGEPGFSINDYPYGDGQVAFGFLTEGANLTFETTKIMTVNELIPAPDNLGSKNDAQTLTTTPWSHFFFDPAGVKPDRHPGKYYCDTDEHKSAPGC